MKKEIFDCKNYIAYMKENNESPPKEEHGAKVAMARQIS
jgi:hypothetical protein